MRRMVAREAGGDFLMRMEDACLDFLMGMEDAPFGIPTYSQKEASGICRGQQCSFKDRLDGFVQFNPLDGVNVVSEFHTGHKGQVCTDTCVCRALSATV